MVDLEEYNVAYDLNNCSHNYFKMRMVQFLYICTSIYSYRGTDMIEQPYILMWRGALFY